MPELNVFANLHKAIGRLCLGDGRARREIAEAAGINPSMLSGYCSGRLVPSIEHLDRLLTALNRDPEDLLDELRMVTHTRRALHYTPPRRVPKEESEMAEAMLKRILDEVRFLIISEMNGLETVKPLSKRARIARARAAAEELRAEASHEAMQAEILEEILPDDEDEGGQSSKEP